MKNNKILSNITIKEEIKVDDFINIGIISFLKNNQAMFIHKTFEDYFSSCFIMKNLNNDFENYSKLLIENILQDDEYKVLRLFLNHYEFEIGKCSASSFPYLKAKNINSCFLNSVNEGLLNLAKFFEIKACFDIRDENGNTPLIIASEKGYKNIVSYLVKNSPKNFDIDSMNIFKSTAFISACENGHLEVVKYLATNEIRKSDIEKKDIFNNNGLANASKNGHIQIVKYLLEKFTMNSKLKELALIRASESGHLEVVEFLIINNHADVNAKDDYDNTSLIYASQNGHLDIVRFLLNNESIRNEMNTFEYSALDYALEYRFTDIADLLVKKFNLNDQKSQPLIMSNMINKYKEGAYKFYSNLSNKNFVASFVAITKSPENEKRFDN